MLRSDFRKPGERVPELSGGWPFIGHLPEFQKDPVALLSRGAQRHLGNQLFVSQSSLHNATDRFFNLFHRIQLADVCATRKLIKIFLKMFSRYFMIGSGVTPLEQVHAFLEALPRWFESLVPSVRLHETAFEMACVLGHPVYDCQYLALAEREEIRMITADSLFVNRVRRSRWRDRIENLGGD